MIELLAHPLPHHPSEPLTLQATLRKTEKERQLAVGRGGGRGAQESLVLYKSFKTLWCNPAGGWEKSFLEDPQIISLWLCLWVSWCKTEEGGREWGCNCVCTYRVCVRMNTRGIPMEEDGAIGRIGSLPCPACHLPVWCSDLSDVVL